MGDEFENTPLKGKNGKILRYADGKPILYKHFLNDLPDEEHEVFRRLSAAQQIEYYHELGLDPPKSLLDAVEKEKEKKNDKK